MKFNECKKLFEADKISELTGNESGLLWLFVRSINRKELLEKFFESYGIIPSAKTANHQFEELYYLLLKDDNGVGKLTSFIKENAKIYSAFEEASISSELYKMKYFAWGGDYTNALDKYLIDRYVKVHSSFDTIISKLETEIPMAVSGYVMCSWYNHWSTILIENIFKQHMKVLPAIGNIKKIDFFVEGIPFDLKTTYVPQNFIETERKKQGFKTEIQELKAIAKKYKIPFSTIGKEKDIAYEITQRIRESDDLECRAELEKMFDFRKSLVLECIQNPQKLIQNLYENQGEMRFDSSNRLFVILVDINNFEDSWKLKRNTKLLKDKIMEYLDSFSKEMLINKKITFTHKAKSGEFSATSDAIFIVKK